MSEAYLPYESSAREIAETALSRANARRTLPREFWPLVQELMTDAAHDAIEFGEAIAAMPEPSTLLKEYHQGYMDAIEDLNSEIGEE